MASEEGGMMRPSEREEGDGEEKSTENTTVTTVSQYKLCLLHFLFLSMKVSKQAVQPLMLEIISVPLKDRQ